MDLGASGGLFLGVEHSGGTCFVEMAEQLTFWKKDYPYSSQAPWSAGIWDVRALLKIVIKLLRMKITVKILNFSSDMELGFTFYATKTLLFLCFVAF